MALQHAQRGGSSRKLQFQGGRRVRLPPRAARCGLGATRTLPDSLPLVTRSHDDVQSSEYAPLAVGCHQVPTAATLRRHGSRLQRAEFCPSALGFTSTCVLQVWIQNSGEGEAAQGLVRPKNAVGANTRQQNAHKVVSVSAKKIRTSSLVGIIVGLSFGRKGRSWAGTACMLAREARQGCRWGRVVSSAAASGWPRPWCVHSAAQAARWMNTAGRGSQERPRRGHGATSKQVGLPNSRGGLGL